MESAPPDGVPPGAGSPRAGPVGPDGSDRRSGSASRTWLTRNVKVLAWVSLAQDAASEMLYPILPVFLTVTLGAPTAVVGIVEGCADAAGSFTKLALGPWVDRQRRRPLIGVGYGLAALGKGIVALAVGWPLVLAGRVLDRFGKGIRGVPRDALLADASEEAFRGRVFGFHRAADSLGAVIGPLLGLLLLDLFDGRIRPVLWVAVIPAVLSALLVLWVREGSRPPSVNQGRGRSGARSPDPVRLGGRFWRVAVPLVVFGLVNVPDALLLLRAGRLGLSTSEVIGAYVLFNLTYTALSYPAGRLSDRVPPGLVVAAGFCCFAVGVGTLAWAPNSSWVWPAFVVYGGFPALTDGVGKAWVTRVVPDTVRGTALGVHQGLAGLAAIFAGTWTGLTWGSDGRTPLTVCALAAAVVACVVAVAPGSRSSRSPT